jgi:hypothetical protein
MPRAGRICPVPGCPAVTTGGRCPDHARQADCARGTRQARGYTREHDRLRRQWTPRVDAGLVDCHATVCLASTRRILSGTAWDLGHTDDRTAWTGPEHARCNRAAGGRAAHGHTA